jgi:hypothetical protein
VALKKPNIVKSIVIYVPRILYSLLPLLSFDDLDNKELHLLQ